MSGRGALLINREKKLSFYELYTNHFYTVLLQFSIESKRSTFGLIKILLSGYFYLNTKKIDF